MCKTREISTCIVRATSKSPIKIHLTPWDLQLLLLNPIQKGLLYRKSETKEHVHDFLDHLKNSLSRTLDFFPPLAGRLATIKHEDTKTQSFYIDCNNEGAQFTQSVATGISVNDILNAKYVPKIVHSFFLLNRVLNIGGISKPLLAVQVTELEDGYFIGCTMNHLVGDGISFWNFFNSWSEISRGSQFPSKSPSLGRWFPEDVDCQIQVPCLDENSFDESILPLLEERFFHFSRERIAALKERANSDQTGRNISSLQAVLAHLWRSIIRCRHMRDIDGEQEVSMNLIADARWRLAPPLPDGYFGNAVYVLPSTTTAQTLLSRGLGWAASQLNEAVTAHTGGEQAKNNYKNWVKSPKIYRKSELEKNNMIIGSSPRFDVYGNDFGWGAPVGVRNGLGNKYEGKISVFPGAEQGSMDFEICLCEETLLCMEKDVEFMQFVQV